jgi:AcrR family transcriptional regulator
MSRSRETAVALAGAVSQVIATAEEARQAGRREGDQLVPLGAKATRTRLDLLAHAYELFVAKGYLATSVQDIHEATGVSLGTFYQYFRDKADVMMTLVGEAVIGASDGMFRPLDLTVGRSGVHRVIDGFVRAYAATADFQAVWEEVTHVDDEVARMRRDVGNVIEASVREAIADGQRAGAVDPTLDPASAARALTAMVDRYCYLTFVVEAAPMAEPELAQQIDTLVDLWARTLALPDG